ncbi:Uncharacterised protein [Mycobacteroides abscessus subsp. abscessus]|nr:Uncharacterised protein [Mycobacteroides abscessus subsp. abscessus]
MGHPLGAQGLTVMVDDEPGRGAVRRDKKPESDLKVSITEDIFRRIEEVVITRIVKILTDIDHVVCVIGRGVGVQRLCAARLDHHPSHDGHVT